MLVGLGSSDVISANDGTIRDRDNGGVVGVPAAISWYFAKRRAEQDLGGEVRQEIHTEVMGGAPCR